MAVQTPIFWFLNLKYIIWYYIFWSWHSSCSFDPSSWCWRVEAFWGVSQDRYVLALQTPIFWFLNLKYIIWYYIFWSWHFTGSFRSYIHPWRVGGGGGGTWKREEVAVQTPIFWFLNLKYIIWRHDFCSWHSRCSSRSFYSPLKGPGGPVGTWVSLCSGHTNPDFKIPKFEIHYLTPRFLLLTHIYRKSEMSYPYLILKKKSMFVLAMLW